jgi:hypothetical protein
MITPRQSHGLGFYRHACGLLKADFRFFDPTLIPPEWREWKI